MDCQRNGQNSPDDEQHSPTSRRSHTAIEQFRPVRPFGRKSTTTKFRQDEALRNRRSRSFWPAARLLLGIAVLAVLMAPRGQGACSA